MAMLLETWMACASVSMPCVRVRVGDRAGSARCEVTGMCQTPFSPEHRVGAVHPVVHAAAPPR